MILKISGVVPDKLHDLHRMLKSDAVKGSLPIDHPHGGHSAPEQTSNPIHVRLLRSKMSEANGSYTVELAVNVDAAPSRVHSNPHGLRVMVGRKVVDAIFDVLGIFPEEETLAPELNLSYDEEAAMAEK